MEFPKNLQYVIKNLSGFSKSTIKLSSDRETYNKGDNIRVKLPSNTIVDLRGFSFFAEGTCSGASGDNNFHFPRLGLASLIRTLNVYINNTLIERIDNYNTLYNKLYDLDGGGIDQISKRHLEVSDPSVSYKKAGAANTFDGATPVILTKNGTTHTTDRKMACSNWIGFLSSAMPCIDTNDLGSVEIEIILSDEKVLWAGASGTASAEPTRVSPSYVLKKVHFTIPKITFNDPLYYNMKASKLLSSGLQIAYQTYICSKGSAIDRTTGNVNASFNTTSLDQLICTLSPAVPVVQPLLLQGSNNVDDSLPFSYVSAGVSGLALVSTKIPLFGGQSSADIFHNSAGDLYNQSLYFKSDASGLYTSQIDINNTPLMPQPMEDYEIFNENLIALGNSNQDMGSGVFPGCRSIADFLKYFFVHIVSLENISKNDDMWKSGLDGKSSALNVNWRLNYNTASSYLQTPYIFAKTTRILQVNEGNSVNVIV